MALRPGAGGGGSFMFPVAGGLGPPPGMMSMQQQPQQQQQGFSMVPGMQPNMPGMMGMSFGPQIPTGPLAMQGGMTMGQMAAAGMAYMGQPPYMGMRPPASQYTADMQKQFAEEQQRRYEHQQKMLEEERKRRQFEEQKQKLRLLSSVKPKTGEKSRDDALEAIKGNLDGFSREAKMHPTPVSHPTKTGVGVFPSQDPIQPLMPHWIYNDGLVPDLYKKVLETTMTPSGIDTAKLYPILMASGLPRETLGQIWGMANRTTPGQLTKEELYMVLAMIAVTQRGIPAMSLDALSQLQAAPLPTLSGSPLSLPPPVPHQPVISMLAGPGVSVPLSIGQPMMGLNMTAPASSSAPPISTGFMMSFSAPQAAKPEEDDFQEFQDASKSGPVDDSFSDFQGDASGTFPKSSGTQTSASSVMAPVSATVTSSTDKYAVFTQLTNKSEGPSSSFTEFGDKYSVFRELEQTAESKSVGDGFEDLRSAGADDGFTDFKTADSISPLEPSEKDKPFTASFPSAPILKQQLQPQQQIQTKLPLKVSELDLFSLSSSGENKSLSFPQESVSSSFPLTLSSSSMATSVAGKSSALVDDFGDFSVFGDSSSATSIGRNDFADFMAFSNATGFSEQKSENKCNSFKKEGGCVLASNSYVSVNENGQHPLNSVSDKYDVFKQLSLEGFEEQKDTFSSVKGEDDFADFQTGKFSSGLSNSDKILIDKVAAFRHAKEDSVSVKSLDLPSIGGSSIGKEDSEDALSVQFDMKLSDVGGDLKHVMSDSSLDLPPVSGQHPPAADMDDLKFLSLANNNNSTAINNLAHCETATSDQSKQPSDLFLSSENRSCSSAISILQRRETSFGSSENVTNPVTSRASTFLNEDSSTVDKSDEFTDFKDHTLRTAKQSTDSEFGDFAGTLSDAEITERNQNGVLPSFVSNGVPSEMEKNELADDFGEFQREKPKISKFDFLVASSQGKVKSSEEMIKNELATFDLSVQGSHKRSLSLGDKEISHTAPPPPQEQGFRDRSNTLNERPALPIIRDRYKDLTGEVEESERYAYEWQRCLESALQVIKKANDTLNGISSSSVCTEVIQSTQGMEYLLGVVEVYRVARRVELGIRATAVCSEKLQHLLKDIEKVWNNLIGFMSLASLTPDDSSLDFSSCILRPGIKNAKELACGVCLLNVESRSKAFDSAIDCFKLSYGGHQYHASCANFWINCVEPKPPGLVLPDLL